jgi:4-amino-4-deoxy-L-arabinose transferase-like glycosyltransferase
MKVAGQSPFAARFLSVSLGVITVALLGRLAAWCFHREVGLAVMLLAALNPFHVAYSQEARMYGLLGLAAVATAWGLWQALAGEAAGGRRGRRPGKEGFDRRLISGHRFIDQWRWWAFYAVAAALTLYAHNLGAFVLLALNLLVLLRREWRRHILSLAVANLVALGLFGPWMLGVLPGQLGFVGRGYWLVPPGAQELVRALLFPIFTFYEPAPLWLLGLGLLTGVLTLALLGLRIFRTRSRAGWFVLLCWVPVLSLFLVSQLRPIYLERALLPAALFYLVAVAWLLARGKLPRPMQLGLVGLLAAGVAGSLAVHFTYAGFPRPPFPKAVGYLRDRAAPGDAVVHTNKLTFFPMHAYAPELPGVYLADPPGSPQDTLARPTQEALGLIASSTITDAVGGAGRVWLVYFPREMQEARAQGAEHLALAWLEARAVPAAEERIEDLVIATYQMEEE